MTTRRRPVPVLVLVALALFAGACGGDDEGYDTADEVLRAAGLDPEAPGADAGLPEGCTRTVTTDEYGFETEVLDCPEEVLEAPGDDADLAVLFSRDEALPVGVLERIVHGMEPSATREALAGVLDPLAALDEQCGVDRLGWLDALTAATGQVRAVEASVAGGLPDDVDGTEAAVIGRALVERLVLQTGCRHPGVGSAVTEDQLRADGTVAATADAADAAQDADQAVGGGEERALFYLYSEIQYGWMRSEPAPLDVAVVGTSQAGDATDVVGLSDALDARVGNAFLPGGTPEIIARWLEEVERLVDPRSVVWYVGALDFLLDCDQDARVANYERRRARLEQAFAAPGWFRSVDPLLLVLGPRGERPEVLGDFPKRASPDPDGIAAQISGYEDAAASASFCANQADVIGAAVRDLRERGTEVYVVGMPTSPKFLELLDGGLPAVRAAFDRLVAEHLPDGAVAIDLLDIGQDRLALWRDLTHMTAAGAEVFSGELAAQMLDAGFRP